MPAPGAAAGAGPRLHFAHATGMNAQLYEAVLAPLADRFAITISDARGHGHTGLDRDPGHLKSWDDFAFDLTHLLDVIDSGSAIEKPMNEPKAVKNWINFVSSLPLLKAGCAVRHLKSKFPKLGW